MVESAAGRALPPKPLRELRRPLPEQEGRNRHADASRNGLLPRDQHRCPADLRTCDRLTFDNRPRFTQARSGPTRRFGRVQQALLQAGREDAFKALGSKPIVCIPPPGRAMSFPEWSEATPAPACAGSSPNRELRAVAIGSHHPATAVGRRTLKTTVARSSSGSAPAMSADAIGTRR